MTTWRQLAQSWQDMWLRWDSQQGSRADDSQAGADEQERMAFVKSLMAQVH